MQEMEIKDYDKNFGAFLVVITTESREWASEDAEPLVIVVKSAEDFMNNGLEVSTDGRPFTDMKVGEKVADMEFGGVYEGVYVMRVA